MRAALLGLLLSGAAAVVACGEVSKSDARDARDAGVDAGVTSDAAIDVAGDARDAAPPFVPASLWKPTSMRLEMRAVGGLPIGLVGGAFGYAKNRADMSPAQLTVVEGLRTTTPTAVPAPSDSPRFTITITDADGTQARYDTPVAINDLGLGTPIDGNTLGPFLDPLKCSWSYGTRACSVPPDAAPPPATCHPTLVDDPGCLNGVTTKHCADLWMTFAVTSPGTYDIAAIGYSAALGCGDTTTIEARSADGATVLGTSAASTAPSCPVLHQTFASAGDYRVVLKERAADCLASSYPPEVLLQIARAN